MLVPNDEDPNLRFEGSVDDGIRKDAQREHAATIGCRRTQAGVLDQELGDAFELTEEALCYEWRGVLRVEIQGVSNVFLGAG